MYTVPLQLAVAKEERVTVQDSSQYCECSNVYTLLSCMLLPQ